MQTKTTFLGLGELMPTRQEVGLAEFFFLDTWGQQKQDLNTTLTYFLLKEHGW